MEQLSLESIQELALDCRNITFRSLLDENEIVVLNILFKLSKLLHKLVLKWLVD